MADVARRAGVSGQTVSRVVNGDPKVSPATRDRVAAAMEELNYRPNRAARALRTGETGTIGVVVETLETVGNSLMLEALTRAGTAANQSVVVAVLDSERHDAAAHAIESLQEQGVDGIVVVNEASAVADDFPRVSTPIVLIDGQSAARFPSVSTDHRGGARAVADHIVARGATHPHHISGPHDSLAARERLAGWVEGLSAAGVDAASVSEGDWTAQSGFSATERLLDSGQQVDAIFAANDQMALGAMTALHKAGISVPGAVAVVGFDNIRDSEHFWPALTTVEQDFAALAVAALAAVTAGSDSAPTASVAAHLIVRDSA